MYFKLKPPGSKSTQLHQLLVQTMTTLVSSQTIGSKDRGPSDLLVGVEDDKSSASSNGVVPSHATMWGKVLISRCSTAHSCHSRHFMQPNVVTYCMKGAHGGRGHHSKQCNQIVSAAQTEGGLIYQIIYFLHVSTSWFQPQLEF